jgi:hypothetical protein
MKTQEAAYAALVASGNYPVFSRTLGALADGFDLDLDAAFVFGLRPLLDGFATQIERAQRHRRRR